MNTGSCRILIVAGETSGERHAAGLAHELRELMGSEQVVIQGVGGPAMQAAGVELLFDVSGLEAIGPWAALANLKNYLFLFQRLKAMARDDPPDLVILVDFPDFNLRLARHLKRRNIPVCYFISPQVWAWRQNRVKQIRCFVDLMLVIFPFEEDFYRQRGVDAIYVGNPSAARLRRLARKRCSAGSPLQIALLPGSRRKEVDLILPTLLDAASYVDQRLDVKFLIQKAPSIETEQVEAVFERWKGGKESDLEIEIREEGSEMVLRDADCALVKSGTSTLEAMILGVPFAMVYRISKISWFLLRPFVGIQTYCLANLVAGDHLVPEFVQNRARGKEVGAYIVEILSDPARYAEACKALQDAAKRLGERDGYVQGAQLIVSRFIEQVKS